MIKICPVCGLTFDDRGNRRKINCNKACTRRASDNRVKEYEMIYRTKSRFNLERAKSTIHEKTPEELEQMRHNIEEAKRIAAEILAKGVDIDAELDKRHIEHKKQQAEADKEPYKHTDHFDWGFDILDRTTPPKMDSE